jgi:hypothetical protein
MLILTKEVQDAGGFAGSNGAERSREVLEIEGGKDQAAVDSLVVVRGEGRALARKVIEAVLPSFADLQRLRTQEYVTPTWVDLWRRGGRSPELLEMVVGPAAQRLLECNDRTLRLNVP